MTFGMTTFSDMDSVEAGNPGFGIWGGEDRKALGALAMSFFFIVQIWDSEPTSFFSIAVGLINEGLFFGRLQILCGNIDVTE